MVKTMGKKKEAAGDEAAGGPEKKGGLKVSREVSQMINKLAAHRDMSVERLFLEPDVQTFFKHLLLAEMTKEAARIQQTPGES